MFEAVKNKIQRQTLINMLKYVVEATKGEFGHAFLPREDAEKLQKADASFVVIEPTVVHPDDPKQIKITATAAAIAAFEPQPATPVSKASPGQYEIVTLEAIPEIQRGGNKADSYPFDKLNAYPNPGHAFFVPATEARPNPAKTLASTVASATKRYSKGGIEKVFTVRKHTDASGKVLGAHVIRTK